MNKTPRGVILKTNGKNEVISYQMIKEGVNFEARRLDVQKELLHEKHNNFSQRGEELFEGFGLFFSCICCNTEYNGAEENTNQVGTVSFDGIVDDFTTIEFRRVLEV